MRKLRNPLVLNIGAGKIEYDLLNNINTTIINHLSNFIKPPVSFNLDKNYIQYELDRDIHEIERLFVVDKIKYDTPSTFYISNDVFSFINHTRLKFDLIVMHRFLEHIPFDKVLYFIYLLSTICNEGTLLDIIVPDFNELASMVCNEDVNSKDFDKNNIIISSEIVNETDDPHLSIWTAERLMYFFEYEGRFNLKTITKNFKYDGRNIYLRAIIERNSENNELFFWE